MAVRGKQEKYWPMREGGPYSKTEGDAREVYACTGCGAQTHHEKGWNGEPNKHNCRPGCPCAEGDLKQHSTNAFRRNFDRIFPNAPGAGV